LPCFFWQVGGSIFLQSKAPYTKEEQWRVQVIAGAHLHPWGSSGRPLRHTPGGTRLASCALCSALMWRIRCFYWATCTPRPAMGRPALVAPKRAPPRRARTLSVC